MGIRTVVLKDELGIIAYTLEQMGFDLVAFYEADQKSAEMCRHNLKSECIQRDLLECPETEIPDMEFLAAQLPRRVFADPTQESGADMEREYLYKYLEIICQKRPRIFLFETFSAAMKEEGFSEALSKIQKAGYCYSYQLCDIGEATGLPVNEKRIYLVGILAETGRRFQFPEERSSGKGYLQPGDICCPRNTVDPWYLKLPAGRVDFSEEQKTHFYCWRTDRYTAKERVDWNLRKMPLIYDDCVLRKITHREMARLKGLPDQFYLDTSNKAWLYRKLAYGSNAVLIRRMGEAVRKLLDGSGIRNRQMVNGYRFESLLERYFRYKNIGVSDGNTNPKAPVDFILKQGDKQILIEAKWYNSNAGIENRIFQVCKRLQNANENGPGNYVLMTGNPVPDRFKHICYEKYGIMIWDVKNVLWLFEEFPDIKSEFVSMLDYTLEDLVPEKPELEFERKDYRESENIGEEQKPEEMPADFREQLSEIMPGKENFARYEKTGTAVLKYVFGDYLTLWEEQKRSNGELYRFDLCCKIKHGSQPEFFDTVKDFFRTKYIVFEFKNYSGEVTQKEIYTTEKYLYQKALRSVAIIVSRKGADKNALRAARGCLRENGKLILCLSDEDLMELLRIKEEGERATADYLGDMLDEMLIHLEK